MPAKPSHPILVTGAAGFVGWRFARACEQSGIPVIWVDKRSHFDERSEHADARAGKIVDRDELFQWLGRENPRLSAIVHLGACTDTTEMDSAYLKQVNTEYSQKLWNYCTDHKVPLAYASSAATYGNGEHGYDDDETSLSQLKPLNPYGVSKQEFDIWALAQERRGFHPPTWSGFKFFNVFGFGERHKGKMASVVLHSFDQIRSQGGVRLFRSHRQGIADGHQARDFIHVQDVVKVLQFALGAPIKRGIYNLGTGQARTFLDLARAVFRSLEQPEKIEFIDTPVEIRERYQYFTEARMDRLRKAGYTAPFDTLEQGVASYVAELKKASR